MVLPVMLCIILTGCAKEYSCEGCDQITPPQNTPVPVVDLLVFVDITLDGKRLYIEKDIDGAQTSYGGWQNGPVICVDLFQITSLGNADEKPLFNFMKGRYSPSWNYGEMKSFYSISDHAFLNINPNPVACCPCTYLTEGVGLFFRDTNGEIWSSFFGLGDQSGNFSRITNQEGYEPDLYVSASFQCNLFSQDGRQVKLTDGRFRMKVR